MLDVACQRDQRLIKELQQHVAFLHLAEQDDRQRACGIHQMPVKVLLDFGSGLLQSRNG